MSARLALIAAMVRTLRRLRHNSRGNVLMLVGFSVIPLTMATGIAIDYSHAAQLQTRMNAAADAAALAAVSKAMSQELNPTVQTMATNVFTAQVSALKGVNGITSQVVITGGVGANNTRTAVVSYTALSKNAFAGVLGMSAITIGGSSTATSSQAPNIDFYLLLDSSPSMLIPATTAGLASITAATKDSDHPYGCAFACHQTNTTYSSTDNHELVCSGSNHTKCIDYYTVARNNGLTLRTDLVTAAVQNLTDVATATTVQNGAKYRMGLSGFDYQFQKIYPTTSTNGFYVDSNLTNIKTHATDLTILPYCKNNQRLCGTSDSDTATNTTKAFNGLLGSGSTAGVLPTAPGQGTNTSGDTPQAMVFIITDGMRDEARPGGQPEVEFDTSSTGFCSKVKARGIRIAVLYTEYLPESIVNDSWSVLATSGNGNVYNRLNLIEPALIACASPGLYYQVTTNSDISGALAALFAKAVSTAHLTQ